jgi:hypothetical protein
MCDVDVFALTFGVEECEPMPTATEDLRDILQGIRRRARRMLRFRA